MDKKISERHARALISLKDHDLQVELCNVVIEEHLNVKQLEARIEEILHPPEKEVKERRPKRKSVSRDVRIALNTIKQSLSLVSKSGIDLQTEEEDAEDYYQIIVKIPKNK